MMKFTNHCGKFLMAGIAGAWALAGTAYGTPLTLNYSVPDTTDSTGYFFAGGGNGIVTLTDGATVSGVDFGNFDAAPYYAGDSLNYSFTRPLDVTVNGTDSFSLSQTLNGDASYDTAGSANQYRETFLYFAGNDATYSLGKYGSLEINLPSASGFDDGLGPDANVEILGDVTYHSSLPSVPEPSSLAVLAAGVVALGACVARRRRAS